MNAAEVIIPGVPVIGQYPVLPTGCEATALTMLLQWAGVDVKKEQVADALPKEPVSFERDGRRVGGNPNRAFVGDPYTEESFGVFHRPIASLLDSYLPGKAKDITGTTFQGLLNMINAGRPVIVWATIDLKKPNIVETWVDVKDSGRLIQWKSPEHCLTLIGYNKTQVIINDPHTGRTEHYSRSIFQIRWEQMGRQAVTIVL